SDDDAASLPIQLPSQSDALDALLQQTRARLVVIDPVVAFLDRKVQLSIDQSIRAALLPLAHLARKHHCVILLVRHLNKLGDQRAVYRGGGSIGLIAACRSAWLLAADPDCPARRILAQNKNNLAPYQPSL